MIFFLKKKKQKQNSVEQSRDMQLKQKQEAVKFIHQGEVSSYLRTNPFKPIYVIFDTVIIFKLEGEVGDCIKLTDYSKANSIGDPLEYSIKFADLERPQMWSDQDHFLTVEGMVEYLDVLDKVASESKK